MKGRTGSHYGDPDYEPVPFLAAHHMSQGEHNRRGEWRTWWQGVFRLITEGGVVRWHCPHQHKSPETAQRCSLAEIRRRFGHAGTVRGVLS